MEYLALDFYLVWDLQHWIVLVWDLFALDVYIWFCLLWIVLLGICSFGFVFGILRSRCLDWETLALVFRLGSLDLDSLV